MTEQQLQTLVNAYNLLRGATLNGLNGEQTVLAGNTIMEFKALIEEQVAAANEEDANESED
jgi:hypothetical protein